MLKKKHLFLCIICVVLLSACQTVQLLDSNRDFVRLMQDSAEAERLHDAEILDQLAYDQSMERISADFARNGDRVVKAAEDAATAQSKVSLWNLAVRSYLKADGSRNEQIVEYAQQGIDSCAGLSDLDSLPTTCGYFHIVVPQAVNGVWERRVAAVKARQARLSGADKLPAADGKLLIEAAQGFMAELDALEQAKPKIDFKNAGENLQQFFATQQDIIFCNTGQALISLRKVVSSGVDWDRAAAESRAREELSLQKERLERREGGLPADTCD